MCSNCQSKCVASPPQYPVCIGESYASFVSHIKTYFCLCRTFTFAPTFCLNFGRDFRPYQTYVTLELEKDTKKQKATLLQSGALSNKRKILTVLEKSRLEPSSGQSVMRTDTDNDQLSFEKFSLLLLVSVYHQ